MIRKKRNLKKWKCCWKNWRFIWIFCRVIQLLNSWQNCIQTSSFKLSLSGSKVELEEIRISTFCSVKHSNCKLWSCIFLNQMQCKTRGMCGEKPCVLNVSEIQFVVLCCIMWYCTLHIVLCNTERLLNFLLCRLGCGWLNALLFWWLTNFWLTKIANSEWCSFQS